MRTTFGWPAVKLDAKEGDLNGEDTELSKKWSAQDESGKNVAMTPMSNKRQSEPNSSSINRKSSSINRSQIRKCVKIKRNRW